MATNDFGLFEAKRNDNKLERSSDWDEKRDNFLKRYPTCAICGSKIDLKVHHVFPFHYCIELGRRDLELDDRNLITLCETPGFNHHLLIGHFDDYKSANLNVRKNGQSFGKTEAEIKKSIMWLAAKTTRLKSLDEMTILEKINLKLKMDTEIPKK
jgi:hypothetical protein